MKFEFKNCDGVLQGTLIAPVLEGMGVPPRLVREDKEETLARAMTAQNFTGKKGEFCTVLMPTGLCVTLAGVGKPEGAVETWLQTVGGTLATVLKSVRHKEVMICTSGLSDVKVKTATAAAYLTFGLGLGAYSFDVYKTKKKETPEVELVRILSSDPEADETAFESLFAVLNGVYEARDLSSEPANMLPPAEFVEAVKALKMKNVTLKVLDKKQMQKLGMNLLLTVAQGAAEAPYLLIMEYMKGKKEDAPVVLVGKGVCFDSGGMNLKPSASLTHMKYDMSGGAAVVGTLHAVSELGLKQNVIGLVPLVENMLSDRAAHTDDVIQSMNGKTVEIANTDAEGRLILADAMWYGQETYHPQTLIDIATLTGVMKYVFGSQYAGLFTNDKGLGSALKKASDETVMDQIWELPLHPDYEKMLSSDIADLSNIGKGGDAGSATAAMFLKNFVADGVKWAHLDIASVGWLSADKPCAPKGATGFGVQLLTQYFINRENA